MRFRYFTAFFFATALIFSALVAAAPGKYQRFDRKPSPADEQWVRRTLRTMTLAEKVGQMISADANIVFWNRESEDFKKLRHHIVDNKVGSVVIFRSEVWSTAAVTNRWQEMAKVPLLISSDVEMGMGMRFDDTPWWVPNMAVGATGDANWARLQGEATAIQSRALGVNWLFAPVADVNNNPDNPVINTRSYGEDPQAVARFVSAFIEGAQSAGAMTCAKHFPGHGDTATDSHIGLPVVDVSRDRLNNLELIPFRAAIESRVGSIMSAHIALPQIETDIAAPLRKLTEKDTAEAEFVSQTETNAPKVTLPGTLSSKIMTGLLREDLKFKGVIVTDAMSMAGVSARYSPAEAAVKAVKAGADMIEKSPDIDAAVAGIRQAVESGDIPVSRINASVERILRAKAALGLHHKRTVDLNQVDTEVSNPRYNDIAQQIADHSITLVRDEKKLLPLKTESPLKVFNLTYTDEEDRFVTRPFVDQLRQRIKKVDSVTFDPKSSEADITRTIARLDSEKYDVIIFSVTVRARSGKGSVALPPTGRRLAQDLIRRKLPLVVISFGNPYMLSAMPDSPSYMLAYSPYPVSQLAAAKALLGEIEINGKLPVSLPGLYPRGSGLNIKPVTK